MDNLGNEFIHVYTCEMLKDNELFKQIKQEYEKLKAKQVPLKPSFSKDVNGYYWYFCNSCGTVVPKRKLFSDDGKTTVEVDQYKYSYCPYCGQKLDWNMVREVE